MVDGWTLQILEAIAAIDVDCHPELCCVRTTRFIISLSPWTSRSHSLTFSSSGGGEGGGGEAWVERSPSSPSRFRKETLEVSLLPRDITLRRPSGGGEGNSLGPGTRAGEGFLAGGLAWACFFFRNCSRRLALLRMVEGEGEDFFFFAFLVWLSETSSLVSREKEKLEPTVSEKLKDLF